ncbi:MAG: YajQ family cyclic di-GMP-binding protein [Acidobacteria bacterium RBG_13_68_16]|nr:MAG: YajQ family cyclic di-GMP-binding protein [Acidobacteria bacterium RBG_13_68_16]
MAVNQSFDITTGCDLQEVDNAVNQTLKELAQRFDFKGLRIGVDLRRSENLLVVTAPDEFKLKAMWEVLLGRMTRRAVPVKNLKPGPVQPATGGTVRLEVTLQQGIPDETARAIVKFVKERRFKKIQLAIQGDQVRVSSPSRDELQAIMAALKAEDFGIELSFGNYRSQ